MIFDSIKLIRIANKTNLMLEEMFLLQTIYDYQMYSSQLKANEIKELTTGYTEYFRQFANHYDKGGDFECRNPWRNMVEKLLRDDWIVDNRLDKSILKFSEFDVSDKFLDIFKGSKTDEELYQIAKDSYPKWYKAFDSAQPLLSKALSVSMDQQLFKIFQKQILGGNRKDNWNRFIVLTNEMFEDVDEMHASMNFEKYINSFNEHLSVYQQLVEN